MRKTKSNSSYTNKWLHQNTQHWHEEYVNVTRLIIIDKADAPKIVKKGVKIINRRRIHDPRYFNDSFLNF